MMIQMMMRKMKKPMMIKKTQRKNLMIKKVKIHPKVETQALMINTALMIKTVPKSAENPPLHKRKSTITGSD
jgi:hypothetical protein